MSSHAARILMPPGIAPLRLLELVRPPKRRTWQLIAASVILLVPALHPVLRPTVGVPSHLLWFAHILPVALVAYEVGLRGALVTIAASVLWVAAGERLFGAGYGIPADDATILALSTAVGLTNVLVAGFALMVRSEQVRRRDLAQLVSAALSASSEAVIVLDEHQRIQYANEAARRLFEARAGQLEGSPFHQLLGDAAEAHVAALLMADSQVALQTVARTTSGRPFAAELSASPVRDGREIPIACLVTVRDQSERLRREQSDRRTQSLSELGVTIASIAHELNNPLAAVVAYAELLREGPAVSRQTAEDLQAIAHEARRAASIARQLLNLVRRGERAPETTDLNQLVERTLKGRAASFAAHGIQVSFAPDRALRPVSVVPVEIEQILANLLANAQQAMHAARGSGQLRIATRNAHEHVEVEVTDDGPGIAPEHLPRLFEAFFTTKPVGVGTGLGLSIAGRIARDHGGELLARSTVGQGATFTLRLPAASGVSPSNHASTANPRPLTATGKRVLIIDDERAVRQSVERILRRHGMDAVSVAEPDAALRELDTAAFDLVFCDIHLGERSGMELYYAAVRRWPELRGRFVFMTGDVLSVDLHEFFSSTGSHHLAKPFELTELLQEVQRVAA